MLASDGGSAEVVHALVEATGISGDGLIRAEQGEMVYRLCPPKLAPEQVAA